MNTWSKHRVSSGLFYMLSGVIIFFVVSISIQSAPAHKDFPSVTGTTEIPIPHDQANWWNKVQENIQRMEYEVTWQEKNVIKEGKAGYHMTNRAQDLRAYFCTDGIQMGRRSEPAPSSVWQYRLKSIGRGNEAQTLSSSKPAIEGHTIEFSSEALTEKYENLKEGIKQIVQIDRSPKGAGSILLTANVSPDSTLDQEESNVEFAPDGNGLLTYGGIRATDAKANKIPVKVKLYEGNLTIEIDDTEAVYPLTIDARIEGVKSPILSTTPDWSGEGDQEDAYYGQSVSTAGDVNRDGYSDVVIGAPWYDGGEHHEGRVFVYHGSASGLNAAHDYFLEANHVSAEFGNCVATAGDVNGDGYSDVIVAEYYYSIEHENFGQVHVYYGSASGLNTTPAWTVMGTQYASDFGWSVNTAGDVNGDGYSDIIIGERYYEDDQSYEGRAQAFYGSPTGLSAAPDWTVYANEESSYFGDSVSTAGDVNGDGFSDVIIGGYSYDNPETAEGFALVYYGSPTGLSTEPAWSAEGNQNYAHFGDFVGTAGDVNGDGYSDVVIGAPGYDSPDFNEGRVFVWCGSPDGLGANGTPDNADWFAEGDQYHAELGCSVCTAGDVNGDGFADIIAGAERWENPDDYEGAVFVWLGSMNGLGLNGNPANADWSAEGNQVAVYFGNFVSTAGDVNGDGYSDVIVGAKRYTNGQSGEGAAFVYHGSARGLNPVAGWWAESNQPNANLGNSVCSAGDVNGDGYSDVIVGAYKFDGGSNNEGKAFVYLGSSSGLSLTSAWSAEGDQEGAHFGVSVGAAGDVNGDGFDDVIVGSYYYDSPESNEGKAFVYHGSSIGLSGAPDWSAESDQEGAQLGNAVGTAGDVNGDGFSDVIIGAWNYDNGQINEGRAYVYHGSSAGLSHTPNFHIESDQGSAWLGTSVSTAGDINGDGFSDIIVGAPNFDDIATDNGRIFVYYGSALGLVYVGSMGMSIIEDNLSMGWSVSTAGDVNGDGYSDVIIGMPGWDDVGKVDAGAVYFIPGSSTGLNIAEASRFNGDQAGAQLGVSVGCAGDVNGDGYSDVVAGAWLYSNGQAAEGRAYCVHGSPTGLESVASWWAEGNIPNAGLGFSINAAGDVNGDGYSDVIVGAPGLTYGETAEGGAFLTYGNGQRGVSLRPQQRTMDNSKRVGHLGKADRNEFLVTMKGRTPYGRGKVRLDVSAEPFNAFPDGIMTLADLGWKDTAIEGADLTALVLYMTNDALYKWRARLKYHPATSPFQQYSRWLTIPHNGWEEADIRAGEVLPTPTPVARYTFESGAEGWTYQGNVSPYDEPLSSALRGTLGLCPSGSSNSFSYWYSPDIQIEDGKIYYSFWEVGSTAGAMDQSVQFRLRINQKGSWQAWNRIVNSFNNQVPFGDHTKIYRLVLDPVVTGTEDNKLVMNFDIMSFSPDDDLYSWIYLEYLTVEERQIIAQTEVKEYPFDTAAADGWQFMGAVLPYATPLSSAPGGYIGLSPNGSNYCFSYWVSPDRIIQDMNLYRASFLMASNIPDADDAVQFRLRVNQKGSWQAWDRVVNSNFQRAPSSSSWKTYSVFFRPSVTGISDNHVVFSFDIMSFDPAEDTSSWLYLHDVTLEEIKVSFH